RNPDAFLCSPPFCIWLNAWGTLPCRLSEDDLCRQRILLWCSGGGTAGRQWDRCDGRSGTVVPGVLASLAVERRVVGDAQFARGIGLSRPRAGTRALVDQAIHQACRSDHWCFFGPLERSLHVVDPDGYGNRGALLTLTQLLGLVEADEHAGGNVAVGTGEPQLQWAVGGAGLAHQVLTINLSADPATTAFFHHRAHHAAHHVGNPRI